MAAIIEARIDFRDERRVDEPQFRFLNTDDLIVRANRLAALEAVARAVALDRLVVDDDATVKLTTEHGVNRSRVPTRRSASLGSRARHFLGVERVQNWTAASSARCSLGFSTIR